MARRLVVEFVGDTSDLDKKLKSSQGEATKTGSALKRVGQVVGGIVAFETLRRGVGAAIDEFEEARKVGAQTEAVIKSTGGAANVTAGDVANLAGAISKKVGIDDEAIQSGANLLLTFKNVRNEVGEGNAVFDRATQAAVDLSAAGFGSMTSTSKQLGKALNDPIKGISALSRSGVTFTAQQQEKIKSLVAEGKALQAQKIILREVESQVRGSAEAQATASDHARVALGNLAEAAGGLLAPAIDKGAQLIATLVNQMIEGKEVGGALISVFRTTGTTLGSLIGTVAGIVGWFRQHETVTTALVGAAAGLTLGLVTLRVAGLVAMLPALYAQIAAWTALKIAFLTSPIGLVAIGLIALGAAVAVAWKESETFRNVVTGAWDAVKAATEVLVTVAVDAFGAIRTAVGAAWEWIRTTTATVWAAIGGVLGTAFEVIKVAATTYFNVYKAIVTTVWNAVRTVTTTVWAAVATALSTTWSAIRTVATTAWGLIRTAVVNPVESATGAVRTAVDGVAGWLGQRWEDIKGTASTAWQGFKSNIVNPVESAIETVKNAIADGKGNLIGWLGDRVDDINKAADKLAAPFVEAFEKMAGAVKKVLDFLDDIIDAVKEVVDWIGKIKLPSIKIPGIGGPTGPIPGRIGGMPSHVSGFDDDAAAFGNVVTSAYRPGDDGLHGQNRARDYGGGNMLAFAQYMAANFAGVTELIHTPLGFGIDNGQRVPLSYWGAATNADHYDHVHVGLKDGGLVTGRAFAELGERPGLHEAVLPLNDRVYSRLGQGIADAGGSGRVVVELRFADGMGWLRELIDVRILEHDRETEQTYYAGVAT